MRIDARGIKHHLCCLCLKEAVKWIGNKETRSAYTYCMNCKEENTMVPEHKEQEVLNAKSHERSR